MKKKLHNPLVLLISFTVLVFTKEIKAQAIFSVLSSNGYNVNVSLNPVSILAPSGCPWGYNYNTRFSYNVGFTGSNIPSSLFTLQTSLLCGSTSNFASLPVSGGSGFINTGSNPYRTQTDCASATVSSLNCMTFNLTIHGPGIPSQTLTATVMAPLPISLQSFKVIEKAEIVQIYWTTAAEINNSFFNVERSTDGINWESVAIVKAVSGNSSISQSYSATDLKPLIGLSFYRLKQVDNDGKFSYSGIEVLNRKPEIVVTMTPNPASTEFTLEGNNLDIAVITFTDCFGKEIVPQSQSYQNKIIFNTASLNSGIYFVNININGKSEKLKLNISQ